MVARTLNPAARSFFTAALVEVPWLVVSCCTQLWTITSLYQPHPLQASTGRVGDLQMTLGYTDSHLPKRFPVV